MLINEIKELIKDIKNDLQIYLKKTRYEILPEVDIIQKYNDYKARNISANYTRLEYKPDSYVLAYDNGFARNEKLLAERIANILSAIHSFYK